ncbi:MAG: 50S ribosomal protein L6 [Planctomycetaceae bacterium]|nr:50S ribosomal protein L6 [Planctomycetaceae bacterium]
MSRIGKKPVAVPSGVKVAVQGKQVQIEGPKGKLERLFRDEVDIAFDEEAKQVVVSTPNTDRESRAFHGLTRSLIQNMVLGVTQGYEKKLQIVGVGYLAQVEGDTLALRVGFANEVKKKIPTGLDVTCPNQTLVVVQGCDKQLVGQFAAEVRAVRKPEPYKGKGVRYENEQVKIKPGKAAT